MRWNLFFWRANGPFIVKAAGLKFLLMDLSGKITKGLLSDLCGKRGMTNTFDVYHASNHIVNQS